MPLAPPMDRVEKIPEPVSEPEEQSIAAASYGKDLTNLTKMRKNVYIEDAQGALLGIPSDLMRGKESIYTVIVKKNRLRGLGVLLVIIALLMAVSGVLR
jgi:hypothetical protein